MNYKLFEIELFHATPLIFIHVKSEYEARVE